MMGILVFTMNASVIYSCLFEYLLRKKNVFASPYSLISVESSCVYLFFV